MARCVGGRRSGSEYYTINDAGFYQNAVFEATGVARVSSTTVWSSYSEQTYPTYVASHGLCICLNGYADWYNPHFCSMRPGGAGLWFNDVDGGSYAGADTTLWRQSGVAYSSGRVWVREWVDGDGSTPAKAAYSCTTLRERGITVSGPRWIRPQWGLDPVSVFCEMDVEG
jgi:hypothetical protein